MSVAAATIERRSAWDGVLREAGVAAVAGALAGMLVGGFGGRIAMRIAGAMSDPSMIGGATTANGNVLGEITLDGTFALVVFSGLIPGIAVGLVYAAVRPWLRPFERWGGTVFGLALLAALGPLLLEPFNLDFRKFGSPLLNVVLFALLFPLFGIAHQWLIGLGERRSSPASRLTLLDIAGLTAAAVTLAVMFVASIGAIFGSEPPDPRPFSLVFWLVAGVAMRVAFGWGVADVRALARRDRALSYALLAIPVVLGLQGTIFAATFLARP